MRGNISFGANVRNGSEAVASGLGGKRTFQMPWFTRTLQHGAIMAAKIAVAQRATAMNALLLVAFSCGAATVQSRNAPDEDISVYESDAANASLNAIAISEKFGRLAMYSGPYDPIVWESDTGSRFARRLLNGVLYDQVTGLSAPTNLTAETSWTVDGMTCSSNKFFDDRWVIMCTGKSNVNYLFQLGRGITAFDYFCGHGKKCWFELKSRTGVFRNAASPDKPGVGPSQPQKM